MSRPPSPATVLPSCPNGLINFTPDCVLVEDADEEIMSLYMHLATVAENAEQRDVSQSSEGLGFLDATQSILELSLDISAHDLELADHDSFHQTRKIKGRRGKEKKSVKKNDLHILDIKLQQDLTALKGRRGDTGSVLWRSSLYLARHLLRQYHHPSLHSLLDVDILREARVLELGCGTGLLAVLLSQICGKYTASDRLENLKLVQRNLDLNGLTSSGELPSATIASAGKKGRDLGDKDVNLEEIDWEAVSEETKRQQKNIVTPPPSGQNQYDLVLAVDCIYNEHLIQPLIDTMARYCPSGGQTVVWVVVELRSADVMTTFLNKWLDDPSGPWTMVRLGEDCMGDWMGNRPRWVGWVAWR